MLQNKADIDTCYFCAKMPLAIEYYLLRKWQKHQRTTTNTGVKTT